MSEDWFLILRDKEISLLQNNKNIYKIEFDIKNTNKSNEDIFSAICDVIQKNIFFDFLFYLNNDLIYTSKSELNASDHLYTIIKVINKNNKIVKIKNEFYNIHIQSNYTLDNNTCTLYSIPFEMLTQHKEDNDIYLHNFNMQISRNENGSVSVLVYFTFDKVIDQDIIKLCISRNVQRIFYRLKLRYENPQCFVQNQK